MFDERRDAPPEPQETLREEIQDRKAALAALINVLERADTGRDWISDGELRELVGHVRYHALPLFREDILELERQLDDDEPRDVELE